MTPLLFPQEANPYRPEDLASTAKGLDVSAETVTAWITEGLPTESDGRIDPFAVTNFLFPRRLQQVPAMQRRWRSFARSFMPFVSGIESERQIHWESHRRIYLPQRVQSLTWLLARAHHSQEILQEVPPENAVKNGDFWRLDLTFASTFAVEHSAVVRLKATRHAPDPMVTHLIAELAEEVVYSYHHRLPTDSLTTTLARWPRADCLDISIMAIHRLQNMGRACSLWSGLLAIQGLSNPHFWVQLDDPDGPWEFDPCLPIIAKHLGLEWKSWLEVYACGVDARRLKLTLGPIETFGTMSGMAQTSDGANAWPCLDWVCGECREGFQVEIP